MMSLQLDADQPIVRMVFEPPTKLFGLTAGQARFLAQMLLEEADALEHRALVPKDAMSERTSIYEEPLNAPRYSLNEALDLAEGYDTPVYLTTTPDGDEGPAVPYHTKEALLTLAQAQIARWEAFKGAVQSGLIPSKD